MKEATEEQLVQHVLDIADMGGISVASVSDGHVFVFTTEKLEQLLDASLETGKAIVFVKSSVAIPVESRN